MNESGSFVKGLMKKRGARLGEILVVHDDSDLNLGKYKIVFGRGPAGHKGAESIIKALGAKDFWRLRIGVRKAGLPAVARRAKAGDFVLKKISPKNKKALEAAFDDALQLLTALPQPRSSN